MENNSTSNQLYYEEYGSGEPLILIAGLASDSQSWLPIIEPLSKHFRVITFDNWGVGRSPLDNTGITIEQMADDCLKLIRYLNLSRVHLLGHSMGGMIAMTLAIQHPEIVDKLILEATSPKINRRNTELFNDWVTYLQSGMDKRLWFRNLFYWIFSPSFFEDKEMLSQALQLSLDYPYPQPDKSFENQVKAVAEFNATDELRKIDAATLIVNGENDLLFEGSGSEDIFESIKNKQETTIKGAAHSIHMEQPDLFSQKVINFLT
jgi:pimeloyl-ACP methyl ester carboxylesterase